MLHPLSLAVSLTLLSLQFLSLQNGINGKSDFIRLHKDLFYLTSITEHLLYFTSHKAENNFPYGAYV